MRLKTYSADSVQAALRLARIELGDDAVLIGSTENAKSGSGAKLSVTFGTDLSDAEVERVAAPADAEAMTPQSQAAGPVLEELRRLRSDLDWIRNSPPRSGALESAFTPVFENRMVGHP